MDGNTPEGEQLQREFDPKRDKAAVKKLEAWQNGTQPDPVMESLGGEPWWRAFLKKKKLKPVTEDLKKT